MLQGIINIINSVFLNCVSWYNKLISASKVSDYIFIFLVLALSIRFLITPIFGSAKSDRARRSGDKGDNDE